MMQEAVEEKTPALAMHGEKGELHMTLEITREATGKTETVHVIGTILSQEEGEADGDEENS